ncbi:glycoside hydrolase family 5 protein [Aulographum hederae CBS 113979]|uniref:glucan 1,3-beta-glucosidase n=1 Tax=Aulographum hederae CBS 113979 TaxID=1176131 RepID=A0A6G1GLM2_9PEZI|nr:glycoside hydrolase family 5 protein [Aulographum hederae CBS 113979]
MFAKRVLSALVLGSAWIASTSASPIERRDDQLKFSYGDTKVRGVNLGGWFVLEPWITPSIFEPWAESQIVKDEYTLCKTVGKGAASKILQNHWNSWITQSDFWQIKKAGLNHVRIPIGYWSVAPVEGDPYVQGAYQVLSRALDWAQAAGIKVMIDLHGAPGSQNGFDNSGKLGAIDWTQGDTVSQTKKALNKIRDDHASHPAVAAIELVNEPMGSSLDMDTVRQFYMDGWGNLKNSRVAITFHDAFQGVNSWNDWGSGMWNLLLDTHHYEIFDSETLQMGIDDHVKSACGFGNQMKSNNKWTISGEWTGGITDCAKWLNGLGVGARYDGTYAINGGSSYIGSCDGKYTGSVKNLSAADKGNLRKFIEAQLDAYESAAGWIFWTWKTEGAPEWDMQDQIANGIFPQPLSDRQYPGQCGY